MTLAQSNRSALLGQMASLADFMYGDGREAFAVLSDRTQSELRIVFTALNDELQDLIAQPDREPLRIHSDEDSSPEDEQ